MDAEPEMRLPEPIRAAACLRGKEWGWKPEAIPLVIDAAEQLGLLNIGGQLQFRLPGAIYELYWVEVNAVKHAPKGLPWAQRVADTAAAARRGMADLRRTYDFIEEGRRVLGKTFAAYEAAGQDLGESMCFIWGVEDEETADKFVV